MVHMEIDFRAVIKHPDGTIEIIDETISIRQHWDKWDIVRTLITKMQIPSESLVKIYVSATDIAQWENTKFEWDRSDYEKMVGNRVY